MIRFADREVGAGFPCLIVAELGTGHQGDMALARELIDAAASSGASCVKLQHVYAEEILHPLSGSVPLPGGRIELYERFRRLERDLGFFLDLKQYAEFKGLLFLCSPFGLKSARELRSIGVQAIKIASPELNHLPLLAEVSRYGVPLFLSTGVSRLADIERALDLTGSTGVVLLHCITSYPAPEDEYNLRVLRSLCAIFGVEVGLSDHSRDAVLVPVTALLNGACLIEKHFTLSQSGSGLDDPIALEPGDFSTMVRRIREAESSGPAEARQRLESEYGVERIRRVEGNGVKDLAASEKANYGRTNRSIHALNPIPLGARITAEMVSVLRTEKALRPGIGPEFLPLVIGARTARPVPAGEGIVWEDILYRSAPKA